MCKRSEYKYLLNIISNENWLQMRCSWSKFYWFDDRTFALRMSYQRHINTSFRVLFPTRMSRIIYPWRFGCSTHFLYRIKEKIKPLTFQFHEREIGGKMGNSPPSWRGIMTVSKIGGLPASCPKWAGEIISFFAYEFSFVIWLIPGNCFANDWVLFIYCGLQGFCINAWK